MIVAVALCDFSQEIMNQPQQPTKQESPSKKCEQNKEISEKIARKSQNSDGEDDDNQEIVDDNEQSEENSQQNKEGGENEEGKQENEQKNEGEEEISQKNEGNKETQEDDQKVDQNVEQSNATSNQQSNTSQGMHYLSFKKDDRIVVKYQYENGWWWGSLLGIRDPVDGYFPSTYVQISHRIGDDFDENQNQEKDIESMGWQEYAQHMKRKAFEEDVGNQYEKFVNDNIDRKEQNLDKFLNPGIKGYKKVKIDPSLQDSYKNISGSFFSKEGDTVFIPIKSQDPLDKACRQLNHYFDYDAWNEKMNQSRSNKSKPNVNRKKEKNDNKFLDKLK